MLTEVMVSRSEDNLFPVCFEMDPVPTRDKDKRHVSGNTSYFNWYVQNM